MYRLNNLGVTLIPKAAVQSINSDAVKILADGEKRVLPADTVAMATGMRAREDVVENLSGLQRNTWVIGDAWHAGNIMNAIHTGFQAAMDL